MEKLRMQSSNSVEDNIAKIAMLFPDCVTETIDEVSGQPKHLIDFEKLKQNLSDSVMSEKAERYQFTWPDKSKAILLANSPPITTRHRDSITTVYISYKQQTIMKRIIFFLIGAITLASCNIPKTKIMVDKIYPVEQWVMDYVKKNPNCMNNEITKGMFYNLSI